MFFKHQGSTFRDELEVSAVCHERIPQERVRSPCSAPRGYSWWVRAGSTQEQEGTNSVLSQGNLSYSVHVKDQIQENQVYQRLAKHFSYLNL